eukprot:6961271-Heterocapsa_arctica.AAC.1
MSGESKWGLSLLSQRLEPKATDDDSHVAQSLAVYGGANCLAWVECTLCFVFVDAGEILAS